MTIDIKILDLKTTKVRACTVRRDDGSYLTIINSRIAGNNAGEAYRHERKHIDREDFDGEDADRIEAAAHRRAE